MLTNLATRPSCFRNGNDLPKCELTSPSEGWRSLQNVVSMTSSEKCLICLWRCGRIWSPNLSFESSSSFQKNGVTGVKIDLTFSIFLKITSTYLGKSKYAKTMEPLSTSPLMTLLDTNLPKISLSIWAQSKSNQTLFNCLLAPTGRLIRSTCRVRMAQCTPCTQQNRTPRRNGGLRRWRSIRRPSLGASATAGPYTRQLTKPGLRISHRSRHIMNHRQDLRLAGERFLWRNL